MFFGFGLLLALFLSNTNERQAFWAVIFFAVWMLKLSLTMLEQELGLPFKRAVTNPLLRKFVNIIWSGLLLIILATTTFLLWATENVSSSTIRELTRIQAYPNANSWYLLLFSVWSMSSAWALTRIGHMVRLSGVQGAPLKRPPAVKDEYLRLGTLVKENSAAYAINRSLDAVLRVRGGQVPSPMAVFLMNQTLTQRQVFDTLDPRMDLTIRYLHEMMDPVFELGSTEEENKLIEQKLRSERHHSQRIRNDFLKNLRDSFIDFFHMCSQSEDANSTQQLVNLISQILFNLDLCTHSSHFDGSYPSKSAATIFLLGQCAHLETENEVSTRPDLMPNQPFLILAELCHSSLPSVPLLLDQVQAIELVVRLQQILERLPPKILAEIRELKKDLIDIRRPKKHERSVPAILGDQEDKSMYLSNRVEKLIEDLDNIRA
jgi:hypothetical protein